MPLPPPPLPAAATSLDSYPSSAQYCNIPRASERPAQSAVRQSADDTIMDVILPPHSLRTFSAAVACLTKIGKEGYVDFDPLGHGLALRALNDAKSAYGQFVFDPTFFERCSSSATATSTGSGQGKKRKAGKQGGGRSRSRSRGGSGDAEEESNEPTGGTASTTQGDDDDDRFLCRVSLRTLHSVLRGRRGVRALRIRSLGLRPDGGSQSQDDGDEASNIVHGADAAGGGGGGTGGSLRLQLSLEFLVTSPKTAGTLRIVHRLAVSDADGVAAVASRRGASTLVSPPAALLRLLDPLKRTGEVALTVDRVGEAVTATTFHHGDAVQGGANGANGTNAVLNNVAASAGGLKTEASIAMDEFVEYTFRDDRKEGEEGAPSQDSHEGALQDNDDDVPPPGNPPPPSVNEEVTLVFGLKEARAMLQFCHAASSASSSAASGNDEYGYDGGGAAGEMDAVVSFHWGGRPVVIEASDGEGRYDAELILATLDHQLVGRGVRRQAQATAQGRAQQAANRSRSG